MKTKVKCPQCNQETEYSKENPYRPFCCERCKMVDLGKWANEEYNVPVVEYEPEMVEELEKELDDVNKKSSELIH